MQQFRSHSGRWCVALVAVLLGLAGSAAAFGADGSTPPDFSMTIPATTVERGDPGTVHLLTTSNVPADLVGQECSATAVAANNESVHPNSDLIVASGASQVVARDVEAAPGGSTTASGTVNLGTTVTVSVRLGPDGTFSGGGSVNFVCTPPVTPPPTTQPAPQVGGISATPSPAAVQAAPAPPRAAPRAVRAAPSFTG
jgi:hypothetical protein